MKRLVLLVVVALAVWVGWNQRSTVFERRASHEAVVVNEARGALTRLRVTVGGRTFVRERLEPKERFSFRFLTNEDTKFRLVWTRADRIGEAEWSGGFVAHGPLVRRHRIRIDDDNGILYLASELPSGAPAAR